jgi:hypothetical protein
MSTRRFIKCFPKKQDEQLAQQLLSISTQLCKVDLQLRILLPIRDLLVEDASLRQEAAQAAADRAAAAFNSDSGLRELDHHTALQHRAYRLLDLIAKAKR